MERAAFPKADQHPAIGVLVSLRPSGLGAEIDAVVRLFAGRAVQALAAAGGVPTLTYVRVGKVRVCAPFQKAPTSHPTRLYSYLWKVASPQN